jgi:hypothetical protein
LCALRDDADQWRCITSPPELPIFDTERDKTITPGLLSPKSVSPGEALIFSITAVGLFTTAD